MAKRRMRKFPYLPVLAPEQQQQTDLLPVAEGLVSRLLTTMRAGGDWFDVQNARGILSTRMLETVYRLPPGEKETAQGRRNRELCATTDAAFMIGMALGRRLGQVGGNR